MIRRRLGLKSVRWCLGLALAVMGAAGSGCGDGDFVPPPPQAAKAEGARAATGGAVAPAANPFTSGASAGNIDLIWGRGEDPAEDETEKAAARSQAGLERARLRILPDEEAENATKTQAQLVRQAVAHRPKPQALVVVPEKTSDAELARAVEEARTARVPVVVVGRPIAGTGAKSAAAAPLVLVTPQSFADSARRLVALSMRNARNAGLSPDGGAILLITSPGDPFLDDRVSAVRTALEAAKVSPIDEVRIPQDIDAGKERLLKRLKSDPRLTMVFGFDFTSTTASNRVAIDVAIERPFIQAGYTSDEMLPRMALSGELAAIADYVPTRLIRKAITTAAQLAQGQDPGDRVELPMVLHESPEKSGVPRLQAEREKARREHSQ